jgi:hypothetical protein
VAARCPEGVICARTSLAGLDIAMGNNVAQIEVTYFRLGN